MIPLLWYTVISYKEVQILSSRPVKKTNHSIGLFLFLCSKYIHVTERQTIDGVAFINYNNCSIPLYEETYYPGSSNLSVNNCLLSPIDYCECADRRHQLCCRWRLYAELVQNQSLGYAPTDNRQWHPLSFWEYITPGFSYDGFNIETNAPVHGNNPHYRDLCLMALEGTTFFKSQYSSSSNSTFQTNIAKFVGVNNCN